MTSSIQNLVVLDPQPPLIDQTITFEELIEIVIGAKVQRKFGNIFRRQRADHQVVPLEDVAKRIGSSHLETIELTFPDDARLQAFPGPG